MGDTDDEFEGAVSALRERIEEAIRPHRRDIWRNSKAYNGGTALAIAATTAATVIPANLVTWARIASGLGTFLIAISRALDFGTRWRWSVNMNARYTVLLDKLDRVAVLPISDRRRALVDVYDALAKTRALEESIPGTGLPSLRDREL
jgi:hypothetical protein